MDSGELTLIVGGRRFSGWQDIRVSRGIERIPGDFDIGATEWFPGGVEVQIRPGASCRVEIDGDTVLTGYVDRYMPSIAPRQHSARIVGRGKCQDLVDCSAYLRGVANQINRATTVQVAEKLAELFGLSVEALSGQGDIVPQFNVVLTETAWDVIDRVARHSEMLAYEGSDGQLVLAKEAIGRHASGFVEGVNVERAAVSFSHDQRFSLYEVVYMPTETLGDVSRATSSPDYNLRARVTDETIGGGQPGAGRFRPLVLLAEVLQNGIDIAERRAQWEKARRIGRSQAVMVTVPSWRDTAGELWQPNKLAPLHLPSLHLPDREWLISEVSYLRGADGTHAELTLMPKEAFLPEPIILQPFDWQVANALTTGETGGSR